MMRPLKNILLISSVLMLLTKIVFAEDITITTYYPSPYGSYKSLNIYNQDESTTQTDFTQALTKAGGIITTDYTANAYTPGIFWSTQNNNATKPKAGIYLMETNTGTRMFFGTSNSYATGITNNALVIDENGYVGIGAQALAPLSITTSTGKEGTPDSAMHITNDCILFGGDNTGREVNSGQISSSKHAANTLCIVGVGNSGVTRLIRMWDNVHVVGTLSKGAGAFLIDHPLDPKNKILRHSFIESPEPVLIYKGRAKLENGQAIIKLPDYFDALNHPEGREINLTCVDGWSPLYLDGKISGNSFMVKTTAQGNQQQEFSWVIYGVRNDLYVQKKPIIVEEAKGEGNEFSKGKYVHPEAFGMEKE